MTIIGHDLESLTTAITGRSNPLFTTALADVADDLREAYASRRILVTGGAGFIASHTIKQILELNPAAVVVADTSENGLAELVRDLRAGGGIPDSTVFEPTLLDVASPLMERTVADLGPFDRVLGFAAAKHVRSERDAVSALSLLRVNVNGTMRSVRAVKDDNPEASVFIVSTDKAADPASLMGASKSAMELLVMGTYPETTSTRFANVAFSAGSLLESWLIRLARKQPLPVPEGTQRYFVSPSEAGRLCLLASVAPPGSIVVPAPGAVNPVDLESALHQLLNFMGADAEVLVTPRDTTGEKAVERFVGEGESARPWLEEVDHLDFVGNASQATEFAGFVDRAFDAGVSGPSLGEILDRLEQAVPRMAHVAGNARLDDRI